MIRAYFDGCCEPINPGGTASFGAVIFRNNEKLHEISQIFYPEKGKEKQTSNNVAEYSGLISILHYLKEQNLHTEEIEVLGDSNLVICQMFGDKTRGGHFWKIKNGMYVPLALEAKRMLRDFPQIRGKWIPREENSIADKLSKAKLLKAGIKFRIQPED